jgi:hypothetical protein
LPADVFYIFLKRFSRRLNHQEGADGTVFEMTPGTYYPRSTVIVHPLLSSIVNYCHASKFQGFDDAEREYHLSQEFTRSAA